MVISRGRPETTHRNKPPIRVTLIGGLFLCIISGLPLLLMVVLTLIPTDTTVGIAKAMSELAFGGSSLLIVVGVALETVRELEAQITLRNYKGFLD